MQHDHKITLSQRISHESHHLLGHHLDSHLCSGSDSDHTVRQELGRKRDLHHTQWWGILNGNQTNKAWQ
jgi:hypothetical protein